MEEVNFASPTAEETLARRREALRAAAKTGGSEKPKSTT
jgi:hypothetical protein